MLKPLERFEAIKTHHCISGSMCQIYKFNRHYISEDILLGIGSGVSYAYWQFKGQPPFLGGRNLPKPSMEELAGLRTGVKIKHHFTSSARKAEQSLLGMLRSGQPVMIMVDMGFLPYFDFGGIDYHFGGHSVVVCGYDDESQQYLIADRDGFHPVDKEILKKARNSEFKPFPPQNHWYSFDFEEKRVPSPNEVFQAIQEQSNSMLHPPISNLGIKGILKTALMVPKWSEWMGADELRWALFNIYIFISPVGGSGGGAFRYMFSRFLREAANITSENRLVESAEEFQRIADKWEEIANWFRMTSEKSNPAAHLKECIEPLNRIAELEKLAWSKLNEIAQGSN